MNLFALQTLSYGVYLVSAMDGERPTGCIANCAMQITPDPPSVAVSISHDNFTNACMKKTGKFALSVLTEKTSPKLIGTFGFHSGRDTDKFAGTAYRMIGGVPVASDACACALMQVIDTMETETHTIFLGKVLDAEIMNDEPPMTYEYYHRVIKGKSPKNAPTHLKAISLPQMSAPK